MRYRQKGYRRQKKDLSLTLSNLADLIFNNLDIFIIVQESFFNIDFHSKQFNFVYKKKRKNSNIKAKHQFLLQRHPTAHRNARNGGEPGQLTHQLPLEPEYDSSAGHDNDPRLPESELVPTAEGQYRHDHTNPAAK